jgi:beta-ureidopropionase
VTNIVRIATTSLATLEGFAPPYNLTEPDPHETLERGLNLIDAAGSLNADLVCLPETFVASGLPAARIRDIVEPIGGPTFRALAGRAHRHRINLVAGMHVLEGDVISNIAVLYDRAGQLVGSYSKKHPTEGEIAGGITPGSKAGVFQTDIGRIGLSICFDLNWHELWDDMKAQGADIVCWISAYEGGFPLQAYAWRHGFTIVSSVQSYTSKIIDRSGRILTTTSRWGRLTSWDVDMDKRWFHTDEQAEKIVAAQMRYGQRVRVETFGEEHMFSIERRDPTLDLNDVVTTLGLVEYSDYIKRCTGAQQAHRLPG